MDYSPWGHKESDMNKRLSLSLFTIIELFFAMHSVNPPPVQETWVQSLGWEDPLEKGKATHSSILTWRIPWTIVHGVTKSQI